MSEPALSEARAPGDDAGTIYLIHFSRAYHHAQHYLGWTKNLDQRLAQHHAGRGSPLIAAAIAEGITL